MYVRRVHKYVPRGAVVWVLRNYITCTNLIGAALLTYQTLPSRVKGLAHQTRLILWSATGVAARAW